MSVQVTNVSTPQKINNEIFEKLDTVNRILYNLEANSFLTNQIPSAKQLGSALAHFIGAVELGIGAKNFSYSSQNEERILQYCEQIAKKLKSLNRKVKPEFVEKRLEKFYKSRGQELSEKQKKLIATILSMF